MMKYTADEVQDLIFKTMFAPNVNESVEGEERSGNEIWEVLNNLDLAEWIYEPSQELIERLRDYQEWCESNTNEDAGQLMEEMAFLAFKSLKIQLLVKSYQSYAPQHDLVVSGSNALWNALLTYLHLPHSGRSIVVEAKNERRKVTDQQLSRLCSILENKFIATSHLGVFFSRLGATGFPTNQNNGNRQRRQRSLRDARATQVLFHVFTKNKWIVVLDHNDILRLKEKGSLPRLLESKIRDIEAASGLALEFNEKWEEMEDLPPHLAKYLCGG